MVNELCCSLCRKTMGDGNKAYGVTKGSIIDFDAEGFRMDLDDEWDVYCSDCMNTFDKLIADYRSREIS